MTSQKIELEKSRIEEVLKNGSKDYEYIFDFEGGYVPDEEFTKRFIITEVCPSGLGAIFNPVEQRLVYFTVKDTKKDRICLISAIGEGTWIMNPSLRLVLPYAKREFTAWGRKHVITHNLETNKKGVFNLYHEEWLYDEKFDILDRISVGKLIVGINGKLGIKADSEIEQMSLECDDILDFGSMDLDPIVFGGSNTYLHMIGHKKNDMWGANVYIKRFSKPKETEEGMIEEPVYTKYEMPNIFEEIKLFGIIETNIGWSEGAYINKVIFEVTFEGKKGLYSVLDNKFILPPIFDKIESAMTSTVSRKVLSNCDQWELMTDSWFGYINDEKYMMKNGHMFKLIEANHSEKEIINKVKQLLPSGLHNITKL